MKTTATSERFWIEIVMLTVGGACAVALLLASLGAVGAVAGEPKAAPAPLAVVAVPQIAQPQGEQQSFEGMVTCSQCGARHSAAYGKTAAECSRSCVHAGAQFALVEGEKTYLLDGDSMLMKKFAGQRTKVVGTLRGNTITVSSANTAT